VSHLFSDMVQSVPSTNANARICGIILDVENTTDRLLPCVQLASSMLKATASCPQLSTLIPSQTDPMLGDDIPASAEPFG
jgi:hypothetical protein